MWIAIYKDDTKLFQFTKDKENLFKDIDLNNLREFVVTNNGMTVRLDIINGNLFINDQEIDFGFGERDYQLIYFRRIKKILGMNEQPIEDPYEFVGWQFKNEKGKNVKRIVKVMNDKFLIECE